MLEATGRERWIANTLAGLAEVSLLRGDADRARALLVEARERYAARDDALASRTSTSACERWHAAKPALSAL